MDKTKICPKCGGVMAYDYEGSVEWYKCFNGCGHKEYIAMTPREALEVFGKIRLEFPSHPHLRVCEDISKVQKAYRVLERLVIDSEKKGE